MRRKAWGDQQIGLIDSQVLYMHVHSHKDVPSALEGPALLGSMFPLHMLVVEMELRASAVFGCSCSWFKSLFRKFNSMQLAA